MIGHMGAGKARAVDAPPPRPGPHPRAEWQLGHRSQPLARCTGRWSGSSLGLGGRLPRHRATEHTEEVMRGAPPCSTQPGAPHSPGSRPRAHEAHAAPPAYLGAGDSGTRLPRVVLVGPGPGWPPAVPTQALGPGRCHHPGRPGLRRRCLRLVW